MNRLFRKGMKLLSRGKSKLHAFTQKMRCSVALLCKILTLFMDVCNMLSIPRYNF